MTTDQLLDHLERVLNPRRSGYSEASTSVKLSAKLYAGKALYRVGGGRWRTSLRAAIEEHAREHGAVEIR